MLSNKLKKQYLKYFSDFYKLINTDDEHFKKLETLKNKILNCKKKKKKVLIFGNGGSAAIASHFAIDLNNVGKVRCLNFSDSSLITCLSNDYGYEKWVQKTLEFHADKGDVLILISSSGMSQNIIKSVSKNKSDFDYIATFSGFSKKNSLSTIGNISFHVNSKTYNHIENIHQIWLLSIVDMINRK